ERLATPPLVDVAVSRMMGLVVVARLAARHGVQVVLRPAADRGTVAEVTLPSPVLARAVGDRVAQPAAMAAAAVTAGPRSPAPAAQPRMLFGAPLALESGPGSPPAPGNGSATAPGGRPFEATPANGGGGPDHRSRAMPAWSDLTGSTQAINGAGFSPQPSGEPGSEPLPQRKADQNVGDGENARPLIPRQLPIGPDTTRPIDGLAGSPPRAPAAPTSGGPLPGAPLPPAAPATSGPGAAPAQSGASGPGAAPARSGASGPGAAPARSGASGPDAPPAWPPVAVSSGEPAPGSIDDRDAPPPSEGERDVAPPPVPESLAAALDMTAELPRVVRRTPETPPPARESRPRFGDETMELPIFRELESAWFRTQRSAPEVYPPARSQPAYPSGDQPGGETTAPVDITRTPPPATQDDPTVVTGSSAMANKPTSGGWSTRPIPTPSGSADRTGSAGQQTEPVVTEWTTAADVGWRAASAAAEREPADTTEAGLPKRVPMAQLVPGGVDKPTVPVQRRTPESVRGLLSAYHRGVQRGRSNPKDDNATSPGAPPAGPSQAGPARGADSGQEEQK
ncbi:MAG TPA: ATPase, partial [Micromonosporaceae bacterium]|nr:ATPase [Micromonosporaceae bacterium]